ncbi:DUF5677 domain-containing protein [Paraburkholderia nemoris]|uniref:DUF5677 domain-containing protein n=1 Tax=Paraburkholderia nemoris TaxID=2793076 RepID=UPI0038BC3D56
MPEQPLTFFLDRGIASSADLKRFKSQLGLMAELANYGSNLIARVFGSSPKQLEDAMVCGLLRQFVAMIDGIEILASQGAFHSANLQVRTALEASLYIEWIIRGDSDLKARYYQVANLRDDRNWAQRLIPDTPEFQQYMKMCGEVGIERPDQNGHRRKIGEAETHRVDELLASSELAEINKKFETFKKKKGYEGDWVGFLDAKSIRGVAKELNRLPEYFSVYSRGSAVVHSATAKDHFVDEGGAVQFRQIRDISQAKNIFISTFAVCTHTYRIMIEKYRSLEMPVLRRIYAEEWQPIIKSIASESAKQKMT